MCPDGACGVQDADVPCFARPAHERGRLHRLLHDVDGAVDQAGDALRDGGRGDVGGQTHVGRRHALPDLVAAEVAHVGRDDGQHDAPKAAVKAGHALCPKHL